MGKVLEIFSHGPVCVCVCVPMSTVPAETSEDVGSLTLELRGVVGSPVWVMINFSAKAGSAFNRGPTFPDPHYGWF